jgi:hypothetical protein
MMLKSGLKKLKITSNGGKSLKTKNEIGRNDAKIRFEKIKNHL